MIVSISPNFHFRKRFVERNLNSGVPLYVHFLLKVEVPLQTDSFQLSKSRCTWIIFFIHPRSVLKNRGGNGSAVRAPAEKVR